MGKFDKFEQQVEETEGIVSIHVSLGLWRMLQGTSSYTKVAEHEFTYKGYPVIWNPKWRGIQWRLDLK